MSKSIPTGIILLLLWAAGCYQPLRPCQGARCQDAGAAPDTRSPPPSAQLGASCGTPADCQSGLCLSYRDTRFCSQSCSSTCPTGFSCLNIQAKGYCIPPLPGARPFGADCSLGNDCQSLICWQKKCTRRCEAHSCPSGYACISGVEGMRHCSQKLPLGQGPCVDGTQCASNVCLDDGRKRYCSELCNTKCPSGFACTVDPKGVRVCIKVPPNTKPFGAPCGDGAQCDGQLCYLINGEGRCSRLCEKGTLSCPFLKSCVPLTNFPHVYACRP